MSSLTLSEVLAGNTAPAEDIRPRREPVPTLPLLAIPTGGSAYVSFGAVEFDADEQVLALDASARTSAVPFDGSVRVERVSADVFAIAGGRLHLRRG